MTNREGNLEAPTRHPIDWKRDDFHDEDSLYKELERVFDICHGCRRCVSLCGTFPDPVRPGRRTADDGSDGVDKKDYWKVDRPVLPVRRLLHDQVPVHAAASLERRFPASDAARQGGQVQERRSRLARPLPVQHRCARNLRRHPDRHANGQYGEQDQAGARPAGKDARRRPGRVAARIRGQKIPQRRRRVPTRIRSGTAR